MRCGMTCRTFWEAKVELKIKLKVKDLYYFMMYHFYTGFAGGFGFLLSIAAAIFLCVRFSAMGNTERLFFFIVAIAFTILNPISMWLKACNQIARNKSLGGELTYVLDDTGFTIKLGEAEVDIKWDQVTRVKDNGPELVVYVSSNRGYVWPKYQLGESYDQVIAILKKHVSERRLRLKKTDK